MLVFRSALNILTSIFNSSSNFWNFFSKYEREFTNAILFEKAKHTGIVTPFPFTEFEVIAKGKAAMAKYITAALAILSNKPSNIEKLEKSQDYFNIAFQLYDDLKDWKIDYKNCNYSYLLSTVIYENQLEDKIQSSNPPDLESIGRMIYLSKAAENQLDGAILSFHKAATYGKSCSLWLKKIKEFILICQETKGTLVSTRNKLLYRGNKKRIQNEKVNPSIINSVKNNFEYSLKHALNYILTQRKIDYPEMQHKIIIPQNDVFLSTHPQQTGDLFQRALLNDTLIDAQNFIPNVAEVIKEETEKIAKDKLTRVRGGWSYFPGLPEMPPDVDCLAQVMQVLVRSKYKDVANLLADPISLLLSDCKYRNCTFETWMIDNKDSSKNTIILKNAIKKAWKLRKGKDNEVQANILYGLFLYDYKNLESIIKSGVSILEKRQAASGYWKSTWYFGSYYGTYVSSRIIKAVKPDSKTLKKAERFILHTQNYDGGWGNLGSDPLNTSIALLTLVLLKTINYNSINRGISFLFSTQNKKGYWERVEFLKMETAYSTFAYRSKTITTQFCIKALVSIISNFYLEKVVYTPEGSFKEPKIKVYPIYKNLKTIISKKYLSDEDERLIDSLQLINKSRFIKKVVTYKKNDFWELSQKLVDENIIETCRESIKRCFESLPMNKMPLIYLFMGDYSFLSDNILIQDNPSIVISLEFFVNIKLLRKNKNQTFYKIRLQGLKNSIPIIIANEYARLALKQMGILKNSFCDNLYIAGFASYFSKLVFPEYPLNFHLFITEKELEWCLRNEWFLKKRLKPYLYSKKKDDIKSYFLINSKSNDKWFPDRLGFFAGYRIIEEFLHNKYTSTLRDLVSESPFELVPRSSYFLRSDLDD